MRAAIILEQALGPVPGGTGRYAVELARALAACAPEDVSVTGWTAWHRDTAAARVPGVRGPKALPLGRRPLIAAWERQAGPAPRGADVVHAPTLLMPPRRGTPVVVTIHDAVPWTHPETLTPRGVAWHKRMAEYAARAADRIIVPTYAVAEELRGVLALDDRVRVIPHGVTKPAELTRGGGVTKPAELTRGGGVTKPAELTQGDGVTKPAEPTEPDSGQGAADRAGDGKLDRTVDAAACEVPGWLPREGYLMTLATLEPRKGLDVLISALADPAAPALPLVLVGQPGWGGVDPVAEAARQGVDPGRIRVLGRIDDAQLATVLRHATMLVMPSRAEGFGLPLLEAMAAGVPVVHSDAPALVEVGGGAGVVVPRDDPHTLAEALRQLAEDERLRAELIGAGRRQAANYSWSATAEAVWNLYGALE